MNKLYLLCIFIICSRCTYSQIDSALTNKIIERYNQYADSTIYDFSLPDNNDRQVKLSDFRNKLIFINFWYTTCAPCIVQIPHEQKLYEKLKLYTDVEWVNISIDIDADHWKNYIKTEKLPGIHLISMKGSIYENVPKMLHINTYPTYLLIDKQGRIIGHHLPRPSEATLEYLIDRGRVGVKSGDAFKEIMTGAEASRSFVEKMMREKIAK